MTMDFGYITIMITAIYVVSTKNPLKAIIACLILFITTALIFASLNRNFISLSIIIIYLGAILVLVLFVIMLTHNMEKSDNKKNFEKNLFQVFLFCVFYKIATTVLYEKIYEKKLKTLENWDRWLIRETNFNGQGELEEMSFFLYEKESHNMQICICLLIISLIVCICLTKNFRHRI